MNTYNHPKGCPKLRIVANINAKNEYSIERLAICQKSIKWIPVGKIDTRHSFDLTGNVGDVINEYNRVRYSSYEAAKLAVTRAYNFFISEDDWVEMRLDVD